MKPNVSKGRDSASKQVQNQELEVDFGNRKVTSQNFSKLVTLPKEALSGCGCNLNGKDVQVDVKLVQKDGEKYIKLTPICESNINDEDIVEEIEEDEDV